MPPLTCSRVAALHQVRDAAGELEVLEAARDLAQGVGRDLAVLGGQQRGDLLAVLIDEVADAEHDLRPLRKGRRAPRGKAAGGGGHGRVDLFGRGEIDPLALPPVAGS